MSRLFVIVPVFLSLVACIGAFSQQECAKLPYRTWYVALAAPEYMEAWVETVDVVDRRGGAYVHVFGGLPSYTGRPEGWHEGAGATMPVNNVDLPDSIFIRWQSLVERKTYRVNIKIPEWVRDEMVKPTHTYCVPAGRNMTLYPHTLTLGVAPGGIVKVWLGAGCLGYREVGRYQAEIEPLGPHRNGKHIYYRAPTNKAQDYIDKHGIPYGTW